MIDFDYNISTANSDDLSQVSKEQLHYDLFNGDLTFRVQDADFSANWNWVPILDFALTFAKLVMKLPDTQVASFEFTESEAIIDLRTEKNGIVISSNYSDATAMVSYRTLLCGAIVFAIRVLTELGVKYPNLAKNPYYAKECEAFNVQLPLGKTTT